MRLPLLRRRKVFGKVQVSSLCEHATIMHELDDNGIPDCTDWSCTKDGKCPYLEDLTVFCPERDMLLREKP